MLNVWSTTKLPFGNRNKSVNGGLLSHREISRNETRTDLCNLLRAYFLDSQQRERKKIIAGTNGTSTNAKMFAYIQRGRRSTGRNKRNSFSGWEERLGNGNKLNAKRFGCILCINKNYNYYTVGFIQATHVPLTRRTNGTCAHFWWLALRRSARPGPQNHLPIMRKWMGALSLFLMPNAIKCIYAHLVIIVNAARNGSCPLEQPCVVWA